MQKPNRASRSAKKKFWLPEQTNDGLPRASIELQTIKTLWFNTGTLCNLTCKNCYIESSPINDNLSYLNASEISTVLNELDAEWNAEEVGFTGGEPLLQLDQKLIDNLHRKVLK